MSSNGSNDHVTEAARGGSDRGSIQWLRGVTLVTVILGAVGSIGLTLRAGRGSDSPLLKALFVVWVFSPFAALLLGVVKARRWPTFARVAVYGEALIVSGVALAIYGGVIPAPAGSPPAFRFLMVPLGSWALIATIAGAVVLIARGRARRGSGG